jgi:phosphatidylglycerophosphatase A
LGSLAAVAIYAIVLVKLPIIWQWVIVVCAFVLGIFLCGKTAADWNSHDHGAIVWDEWVAQWMVLALLPFSILSVVAGFLLFRLFDIWKPWPVSWIDQHIHGGFGIMLDDIMAGLLAVATFWMTLIAFTGVAEL